MDRLCYNGKIFEPYEYPSEDEFEKAVIEHSRDKVRIFGYKEEIDED